MWVFTLGSRVDETLDLYPTSKGMPSGLVMPLGARHGLHSARFASLSGFRVTHCTAQHGICRIVLLYRGSLIAEIISSSVSFEHDFLPGNFVFPLLFDE